MLLRQLEYLDAVAREEHFGRAADACHVSQPALSTGLARLERELGMSLVRRGRQFEGLTAEGHELLAWARSALAGVHGLREEAARLRSGLAGTLRLGMIPTASTGVGAVLGGFMREQPEVGLHITTAATTEILAAIGRHELDAGLVYVDDPLDHPMHVVPLYRERLLLLTSDPRWDPGRHSVTWKQAATLPLCLLEPTMHNRQLIDRTFAAAGLVARPRVEADSIGALIELGCAGLSCIVADRWLEGRTLPAGVHVHALTAPVVSPMVGLVSARGALVTPTVRALRETLSRPTAGRGSAAASH